MAQTIFNRASFSPSCRPVKGFIVLVVGLAMTAFLHGSALGGSQPVRSSEDPDEKDSSSTTNKTVQTGKWPELKEPTIEEPAKPEIPRKWFCEPVTTDPVGPVVVHTRSPAWKRSFHFGLSVGYQWMYPRYSDVLLNAMPVMEIRWARPEHSSKKSSDRVFWIGLRIDAKLDHYVLGDKDTDEKRPFGIMAGPMTGFRMYWPGEKDSGIFRLFHGPGFGIQYSALKIHNDKKNPYRHFVYYRLGYELGIVLYRHVHFSANIENSMFIFVNIGFNLAFMY